jgi:uncharacterized protein (DUF1015 family)
MPGMGISELPIPDGLALRPFRGVRFAVDDPAKVTSPPYDLISDGDVRALMNSHPNNVVRLILPLSPSSDAPASSGQSGHPEPSGTDTTSNGPQSVGHDRATPRYAQARDTLQAWLASGILAPDDQPALYVYEQRGPGILQRGLIGDVCLADPAQRIILPHEDVLPGPIADRLALMGTTQANLEPIFLLYNGAGGTATAQVDEIASTREPLATARTEDGLTHRLWAITDRTEIAEINADLHDRQALIADGHHRYATYRVLQRQEHATRRQANSAPRTANATRPTGTPQPESQAATGQDQPETGPWDFGLALLVDSTAYPPNLQAIHRVIPGLDLAEATARAKGSWRVHDLVDLDEGLAALDAADDPAFLLVGAEGVHLLSNPDPVQLALAMPADRSNRWNSLNTSVLTQFVLPKVWGLQDDEETVRIVHHDPRAAARLAISTGGTAVILKPLAIDDVLAVAAGGERVPRKSTSFGPKPRTGLVLRTFAID